MPTDAGELNERGHALNAEGKYAEAENAYREAADAAPEWSAPWYNLGLLFKVQRRWAESADCNRRATDRDQQNEAAWWNLGIAATALGDWALARLAWRGFGITIPDGDGPLDLNYGSVPIRLDPDGRGEVVWGTRIDPARAIIRSVPLPRSSYREGDIVLHDGEPRGTRELNGREVAVFDALQLLERSPRDTHEAWIVADATAEIERLVEIGELSRVVVEDWSRTVSTICRQCSEGSPHSTHATEPVAWKVRRHVGLSAETLEQASRVLLEWASARPSRQILELRSVKRALSTTTE